MADMLIRGVLIPLILTEIIELPAALALGVRSKRDYLIIALTNIVTNLCLNIVIMVRGIDYTEPGGAAPVALMELLVMAIEWQIFRKGLEYRGNKLVLSVVLNGLSIIGGMIWVAKF